MPRHADPAVEQRVLDVAQNLWRRGGDKKLSMRILARAARTNTPAIYRRFKNRQGILRALLLRLREDLYETVSTSHSLEEACARFLDFALARPQEYQLYHAHFHELLGGSQASRQKKTKFGPVFLWVQGKLADQLGGTAEDHQRLTLSLWALAHGTAMLLIQRAVPTELREPLRQTCLRAFASLVRQAGER